MKYVAGILAIIAIVFFLLWRCERPKTVTVVKKGVDRWHTREGRKDTVYIPKPIYAKGKSTVKLIKDTVHHWHTGKDTSQIGEYLVLIDDTLRGEEINRDITIIGKDSIPQITRVDTVFKNRTDTLVIENKKYWKGFRHGAAATGAAIGLYLLFRNQGGKL